MIEFHDVYNTEEAIDVLWMMLVERSKEEDEHVNISHRALPARSEHEDFVNSVPYYLWYLIMDEDRWLGYVSVTWRNEVGIMLFPAERGKGYGKKSLQKLLAENHPLKPNPGRRSGNFLANINPRNARSVKLFTGLGFSHIQNTYELARS